MLKRVKFPLPTYEFLGMEVQHLIHLQSVRKLAPSVDFVIIRDSCNNAMNRLARPNSI